MPPIRRRAHDRFSLPRLGRAPAAAAVVVAAALLAGGGSSSAADACTISWDGGAASVRWEDAANWTDDRLPNSSDEVCIGSAASVETGGTSTVGGLRVDGALTVVGLGDLSVAATHDSAVPGTLTLQSGRLTLDGDMTVEAFRQSGGTLLGSGTVATPDFRWTAGAEVGSGTTELTGSGAGLALSGAVHTLDASRRLKIDSGASVAWTAGDLELRAAASVQNAGLIDVRGDQDWSGCCGSAMSVVNEPGGTIRKSAGDGETRLTYPLTNDGTLDVRTGTLAISGGSIAGHRSAGAFDVADGATLAFTGSDFNLGPASVVTGHGSGGLLFTFGAVRFAGRVQAPVEMDGPSAYAFFDSDVTLPSVRLSRGFLGGTGRIATPDLRWSGGVQIGIGRTEVVAGGPGLAISGDREHGLYQRELRIDSGATAAWTEGTIAMTESAAIENAGLFDVRGDLSFSGCCDPHPRVHNAAGGTFRKSAGDGRAEVAYPFRNDGTIEADAGTLALAGGLENFESDTLTGGSYVIRGALELPGARVVHNAATVVLDGPGSRIQDSRERDGLRDLASNDAIGDLTLTNGRQLELVGSERDLDNAGSVTVGPDSALRTTGAYRQSGGLTTLASPSAAIGGADVAIDGGVLRGVGTVDGQLTNAGDVQPGLGLGILTVTGGYTQTADGALSMQIGGLAAGTGHDRLDVVGGATLAGALRVETVGGFAPGSGDGFELIRHASVDGEFDAVSGLQPDGSHSYWPPEYEPDSTWLRRAAIPQASIGDAVVTEGDSGDTQATFDVTLSQTPTRTVRIPWRTVDGTATAPDDYQAVTGTVSIPHGHDSVQITVPVHGDTRHEPDEQFRVELGAPSAATIARGSGTATIVDDDPAPPPVDPPPTDPPPTDPRPPTRRRPTRRPQIRRRRPARLADRQPRVTPLVPPLPAPRRASTARARARASGAPGVRSGSRTAACWRAARPSTWAAGRFGGWPWRSPAASRASGAGAASSSRTAA